MSISDYSSVKKRREIIISALQTVSTLVGELELDRDINELDGLVKQISEGIFSVIVVGEFMNGQSTLINAIFGDKLFIANHTPATAIITLVVYGTNKEVAIYENKKDTPRYVTLDDYQKEFALTLVDIETIGSQGYLGRFEDVDYAKIECLNPLFEKGIRLVDYHGLGERVSRTKLKTNFLGKAQAVIFVLNAPKILGADEVEFIENDLGEGRLDNVFFVINRIHTVYDDGGEEGVQEVKDYTQGKLKHHFLNEKGEFDEEFYNRRVFYVNAKGALDARTSTPINNEMLEVSGVPALEKALENFLTSDEQVAVAFNTIINTLNRIVEDACQEISTRKTHLNQRLNEADEQDKQSLDETESQLLEQLNIAKMAADSNADISENFDTTMETKTMTTNTSANQQATGNESSYGTIKAKSDALVSVLEDISVLIGERKNQSVHLTTGRTIDQPGLTLIADAEGIAKKAKEIRKGIFNILIVGEFKNGKSTLLNAILGDKILIAKPTPATAIITLVVYGTNKKVAIYENNKDTPRYVTLDDYQKEFALTLEDIEIIDSQGYLDRFKDIDYATMECLNPFCEKGIRLVDSPGLGEQVSHTKVTTNYLSKAQSLIVILNATKILGIKEVEFIEEELGKGRLDNVFFVINRINLVYDDTGETGVQEVKDYTHAKLKHHFLNEKGQFDEHFYSRRVFFVNAKGALDARKIGCEDDTKLQASSIPALEAELEHFLTSEEKNTATIKTTFDFLHNSVKKAFADIKKQKIAAAEPLAVLEGNKVEADKGLAALEAQKVEIEQTITRFGEIISGKIFANLKSYINDLPKTWEEDSKELNLDEVSIWGIFKSLGNQDRIKNTMKREIEKYIKKRLEEWGKKVPTLAQKDIEDMNAIVKDKIEDFHVELTQIRNFFSTGQLLGSYELDTEKGRIKKGFQSTINVLMLDPSGLTGTLMGSGDWGSFIGRILLDFLIYGTISAVATPVVGVTLYVIQEIIHTIIQGQGFKERLIKTIGEQLFDSTPQKMSKMSKKQLKDIQNGSLIVTSLPEEISKQEKTVREKIQQNFAQEAKNLTNNLQAQIDQQKAKQEDIILQKSQAGFSTEQETNRLDAIANKLIELVPIAGVAADKRPEEITQFVKELSDLLAGKEDKKVSTSV